MEEILSPFQHSRHLMTHLYCTVVVEAHAQCFAIKGGFDKNVESRVQSVELWKR